MEFAITGLAGLAVVVASIIALNRKAVICLVVGHKPNFYSIGVPGAKYVPLHFQFYIDIAMEWYPCVRCNEVIAIFTHPPHQHQPPKQNLDVEIEKAKGSF